MYKDMCEIYKKTRHDHFIIAVSYLLQNGFDRVREIKPEDIEKIEEQPWATAEFLQSIVSKAVEIAGACDAMVELIQFCTVERVFDTRFYARDHIPYDRMSEIATNALWALHVNGGDWKEELDDAGIELEPEETYYFGIDLPEEEEEDDYDE